jgi:hypothetical protein
MPPETPPDFLELSAEITNFFKHLEKRYSQNLLNLTYGEKVDFRAPILLNTLKNVGGKAHELKALREWLMRGIQCFEEYPPGPESVVQLCALIRQYPITEYTNQLVDAWRSLDAEFGQCYGRQWKSDARIDALTKERVWLHKFAEHKVSAAEILEAMSRLNNCGYFRTFMPKFDEFLDAVYAVRFPDAPLVEEAWGLATCQSPEVAHAAVRRARGHVGGHELRIRGSDRDIEQRFKSYYRQLLLHPELVKEYEPDVEKPVAQYLSSEEILASLINRSD